MPKLSKSMLAGSGMVTSQASSMPLGLMPLPVMVRPSVEMSLARLLAPRHWKVAADAAAEILRISKRNNRFIDRLPVNKRSLVSWLHESNDLPSFA